MEVVLREAENRKLLFLLNCDAEPVEVTSLPAGIELLSGDPVNEALRLQPYGCTVIRLR
ncbi:MULTISPECIES: Beta-galactosidase C-terminal domain [Sinorhizobium]|uniref:Beta-galactosidase C-terminal domain n=1 Tax=Sinorhizobium TaxID=28105 RepID=UPI0030784AA2